MFLSISSIIVISQVLFLTACPIHFFFFFLFLFYNDFNVFFLQTSIRILSNHGIFRVFASTIFKCFGCSFLCLKNCPSFHSVKYYTRIWIKALLVFSLINSVVRRFIFHRIRLVLLVLSYFLCPSHFFYHL